MVGKNPSNQSSNTERNVDDLTFNPRADATSDSAAFNPEGDYESVQPVGTRGAANQPTGRDFEKEDKETEQSEISGRIPKGEVNDLLESAPDVQSVQGRTRGVKVDVWKQDKELDQAMVDNGVAGAEKDVVIGNATGR